MRIILILVPIVAILQILPQLGSFHVEAGGA
jgi:hypothetical protein